MAPKGKSRLVEEPPSASSSEEQEQVEESQEEEQESEQEQEQEQEQSEEEQESEEEEEEPKTAPPVQKIATNSKTPQTKPKSSSSSSESGSGSDSDSDSGQSQQPSPSASDFTVKPSAPVVQPSKVPSKRPQEAQEKAQKDSTRSRKKPKIAEEQQQEDKKALSSSLSTPNRLWNDEDQIAVLKGMAEFKAQKGIEPNSDMSAFHDFVKGKLQVEVSKSQLSDKVRRLKKKFLTHVKNSGGDPVFPKAHDYLVFEYSKKIWGSDNNNNAATSNGVNDNVVNTNGKAKKNAAAVVEVKKGSESKKSAKVSTKSKDVEKPKDVAVKEVVKEEDIGKSGDRKDFQSKYPHLAASFDLPAVYPSSSDMLKKNMSLIDGDKAKVLEEKWKKLHDAEADLMLRRLDLVREHYKLVVDAMRGN